MTWWVVECVCVCAHACVYLYLCRDSIDLGLENCRYAIDFYEKIDDNEINEWEWNRYMKFLL